MEYLESINHLRWQCRRGMLELDEILLNFLNNHYTNLSYDLKLKFNKLLKANDADLFDWLFNKSLPSTAPSLTFDLSLVYDPSLIVQPPLMVDPLLANLSASPLINNENTNLELIDLIIIIRESLFL